MNLNEGKEKLYLVYQITNLIDGKIYIGIHSTYNEKDNYMGSSQSLKRNIKKLGRQNFKKEILYKFNNRKASLLKEKELVTREFCMREDTYNCIEGGKEFFSAEGMVCVRNPEGGFMMVYLEDPRYASGELKHVLNELICTKDNNGNLYGVRKDDPRYISGELVPMNRGVSNLALKDKVQVYDEFGKLFWVDKSDPRWLAGELVATMKNKVVVKDGNGKTYKVDMMDPRYLSGELVPYQKGRHYNVGTVTVKDEDGKFSRVSVDDPRYLSGELVSNMKGVANTKGIPAVNRRKVEIDGIIYDSLDSASKAIGISKTSIFRRIRNDLFNYSYCQAPI